MIPLIELFVGLAGGLAVGAGFVAFLTVLGIIPRLIQLSKSAIYTKWYEGSVVLGVLSGTFLSFNDSPFGFPTFLSSIWGLFHGIFIGMLAAALTEVLNVFPILARRIGVERSLLWFLMAIVLGKITGSLFQWTIFVK
ncbi:MULTISPECIES: stage V sporulation protein AB [Pontibacillus]|uniref:Stage V sporulation protein AB n=1 Tax=Pontibacillus chungwhensis TaxID=265426 RepID=A0ABY8USQ1_9BACI|nr:MULTISPECIES: stage V sporulation protein AB [Pontibacillus]MCD5323062.1 stage V sporulation protein AB [Pontibacillus sp. HN14]WIF96453.1 stage V sporulation protein AB [Pontibacillus chungwhensis]